MQPGYVKRDLGYIDEYLGKGYVLQPKEQKRLETIRKVCKQQKEMFDNHSPKVTDRIVSLSQPYIRPIVRGKAKSPVEFGVKFDLSVDEQHLDGSRRSPLMPITSRQPCRVPLKDTRNRPGTIRNEFWRIRSIGTVRYGKTVRNMESGCLAQNSAGLVQRLPKKNDAQPARIIPTV